MLVLQCSCGLINGQHCPGQPGQTRWWLFHALADVPAWPGTSVTAWSSSHPVFALAVSGNAGH